MCPSTRAHVRTPHVILKPGHKRTRARTGSVATLQRALESIEDERKAARKDFVAACHLAAFHGLADGAGSTLVARVPGGAAGEACLYSVPWGMHYLEVSSDAIVMRDAEQIEEQGREPGVGEGAAAHIFRQAKGVNAVLIASPAHVSALALRCSSSGPGVDQDHFRRNLAGLVGLRQVSVVVGGWEGDAAALAAIASAEVEAAEDGVGVVLLGGAGVLVAAPSIGVRWMSPVCAFSFLFKYACCMQAHSCTLHVHMRRIFSCTGLLDDAHGHGAGGAGVAASGARRTGGLRRRCECGGGSDDAARGAVSSLGAAPAKHGRAPVSAAVSPRTDMS